MSTTSTRTSLSPRGPNGVFGTISLAALGAVVAGLTVGTLVLAGQAPLAVTIALVVVPIVIWQRPELGPVLILFCTLVIEQYRAEDLPFTTALPFFRTIALYLSPADILLLILLGVYLAKLGTPSVRRLPSSPTAKAMLCLFLLLVAGLVIGRGNGGDIKIGLLEARPFTYLALTYLLTAVLVTSRKALDWMLWGFVIACGLKAVQGVFSFITVRNKTPRPEALLAHEESLFFAIFLVLLLGLWLFNVRGSLRKTATILAPLILTADMVNSRRTAWLVLGVGVVVLLVVCFAVLPQRRRLITRLALSMLALMSVYIPLFWNKSGTLAQPARAIRSQYAPTPRDQASDLYRLQENANLWLNIQQAGVLGTGLGVPISYSLSIVDISDVNPMIAYIPHNGVLYVIMRFGVPGTIAFWAMLGFGIVASCRLARASDPKLAVIGGVTAAVICAYVFQGQSDQGFYFFRVAFVVGTLLGLVEAASRMKGTISNQQGQTRQHHPVPAVDAGRLLPK